MVRIKTTKKRETRKVVQKECSICYEKIKKNQETRLYHDEDCCSHTFCSPCIRKWAKQNNTCPLCRKEFTALKTGRVRTNITPPQRNKPWELPFIESLVFTDRYRPGFEHRLYIGMRFEQHIYRLMCLLVARPGCPFDEATVDWLNGLQGTVNNPIVVI